MGKEISIGKDSKGNGKRDFHREGQQSQWEQKFPWGKTSKVMGTEIKVHWERQQSQWEKTLKYLGKRK